MPGVLRGSSSPDKAAVSIDGAELGDTPASLEVEAGERSVRVQKEEYLTIERKVVIEGFGREQTLEFELKTALGIIAITTKPDQATVRIDGRDVGASPRSEERRVGKECVGQCRSRCWPSH